MSFVIGISGFTGVGKSTAVQYLSAKCSGEAIYLGDAVLKEVKRRNLPDTRESERTVRLELRDGDLAALAKLSRERFIFALSAGAPILIDAIMALEEFSFLKSLCPRSKTYLLEINAPIELRLERLALRQNRPFTLEEIEKRDKTELEELGIGAVFSASTHTLTNDETLAKFYLNLDNLLSEIL